MPPKPGFPIPILVSLVLIFFHGYATLSKADNDAFKTVHIGAIMDTESRIGKEMKTAIKISAQNFSKRSKRFKLRLYFRNSSSDPLQATFAAEELIKKKGAQVVLGMQSWQETALVAQVGKKAQTPILSFATPVTTPPSIPPRWPFLLQMATNETAQINCIASIISFFHWRKVIVIYEEEAYGGDPATLSHLLEAIHKVGSELEYRLVLPPVSSLRDPQGVVRKELLNLLSKQSRAFILLRSSLPLAMHLFREAKDIGVMGRDSVWIITESIASLIHTVNSSVISSMEGALGIKSNYSETNRVYQEFYVQFRRAFRSEYPEEDNSQPGVYALRAYDGMTTITNALEDIPNNTITLTELFDKILSSNFSGLGGQICFEHGSLSHKQTFRIINIIGKSYRDIGFWSSETGLSKDKTSDGSINVFPGMVHWPGDLWRVPKGWAMPTSGRPLRIGIPRRTSFQKLVKVTDDPNPTNRYEGFCIDVFDAVVKILEEAYEFPYIFEAYSGSYDDLVNHVYNKSYDAVVGDVTILADRWDHVEFTQPFAESGLTMIVPNKKDSQKAWMFVKPFTMEMWMVTFAVFIYTTLVVWFLEHRYNPDFGGPLRNQLVTALSFTFSTLFFAHREKLHNNFTRMVVVVWLFVVLIINSSYTASLASMLTVQRLQPNVTDIKFLRRTNSVVGYGGLFMENFLVNVLKFKSENIRNGSGGDYFDDLFKNGSILAAFMELPYANVFINEYCTRYTAVPQNYRFGGLGFVFQKGSPIAMDVSKAILTISENGQLKEIQEKWFSPSTKCLLAKTTLDTDNLSIGSFLGLYLITVSTSTICFLLFCFHLVKNFRQHLKESDTTPGDESVWIKANRFVRYFHKGEIKTPGKAPTFPQEQGGDEWILPLSVFESTTSGSDASRASPSTEVEMAETPHDN